MSASPSPADHSNDGHRDAASDIEARRFPCARCGASLEYKPGDALLVCPYCNHHNPIESADQPVEELDFRAHLKRLADQAESFEASPVRCGTCGAEVDPPASLQSFPCPYCGASVVAQRRTRRLIRPRALLPFKIDRETARAQFRRWLRSRWFAPGKLKKFARLSTPLTGLYVPYWTYDAATESRYRGSRGEHVSTFVGTGNNRRRKRRTRWYPASGVVHVSLDDILVLASRNLPRDHADQLEPWDLSNLVPYQEEYVSGFQAEAYQVGLEEGFQSARRTADSRIRSAIRRDIGGDVQRIDHVDTHYHDITFKHILLPVWIASYRFRNRVFRVLVNARTGEVQGDRPWSRVKIIVVILLALLAGAGVIWGLEAAGFDTLNLLRQLR